MENREKTTGDGKRLRVLAGAFAFSPCRGSEGRIGWSIVTRLASHHDVTVLFGDLTATPRSKIEWDEYQQINGDIAGLSVRYVPAPPMAKLWNRLHRLPGMWMFHYLGYEAWQQRASEVGRKLHKERPFDLSHQITYTTYREPGFLWKLPIPYFWGPFSGTENVPSAFYKFLGSHENFRPLIRDTFNRVQLATAFRCRKAAKRASNLWVVSAEDQRIVETQWMVRAEQLLDTGCDSPCEGNFCCYRQSTLRMAWSGLHVARKALPILLRALATLPARNWHLDVLGDGMISPAWRQLAGDLGFGHEQITWHGQVPRQRAIDVMKENDVFIHTGIKEGTTNVIMEALTYGLPVMCHDAGGMGIAVNESCGIKVPLKDPETSIEGFAAGIRRFLGERHLVEQLSAGALQRARELSWDALVRRIADSYSQRLLDHR